MAREPNLHRVPVVDQNRQLRNLITQSRIIELLHTNRHLIGSKRAKTAENIVNLGVERVRKVNESEIAMNAFQSDYLFHPNSKREI